MLTSFHLNTEKNVVIEVSGARCIDGSGSLQWRVREVITGRAYWIVTESISDTLSEMEILARMAE